MDHFMFTLFFAGMLMANVLENYWRERERFAGVPGAGFMWHTWQWLGWIIAFVYTAVLIFQSWYGVLLLMPASAVWWIGYSGWLNLLKKRPFFYKSDQSSSTFEKVGTAPVKIGYLIITVIILLVLA